MASSQTKSGEGAGAVHGNASRLLARFLVLAALIVAPLSDAAVRAFDTVDAAVSGTNVETTSRTDAFGHRASDTGHGHADHPSASAASGPCVATGCDPVCSSACPGAATVPGAEAALGIPRHRRSARVRPADASFTGPGSPDVPFRPPKRT